MKIRQDGVGALGLVVALAMVLLPTPSLAQPRNVVELQLGGGYTVGDGPEDPGPSLSTYDVGVAVWLTEHWGIAARHVVGPGKDLWDPPLGSGPLVFVGKGELRYSTVTARYRTFSRDIELNIGFGVMFGGSFNSLAQLTWPSEPPVPLALRNSFGGFALELFIGHRLLRHLGVKAGATADFNFDTTFFHPVALGVVSF